MSGEVPPAAPSGPSNTSRGPRRGGRGGGGRSNNTDNDNSNGGRSRGRGGRGRGGRGRGNSNNAPRDGDTELPAPVVPPPNGSFGARLSEAATTQGERLGKGKDTNDEEAEGDICFICASTVVHNSVAPCNHRTCHICALRMRALYKTKACAHCRTESDFVIFTDDATKRYEDYTEKDISSTDTNLGIKYENAEIFEDTVLLLRYNCPDPSCDVACLGWPDLNRHVKTVHHVVMCNLCTRNKKVFTHEHELFTMQELRKHEKFGDDHPGAVDQSGFRGHPECGFCRQRFYGDDELYAHCRDQHERCHICDRQNTSRQQQYFVNYDALEVHFRKDHFLCPDQECLDKKFVVFDNEVDLKAHQLEAHPNGLSKDARRDARRVDMSSFAFRDNYRPERRGGREGRGRGRGRDPNSEPLPQSSAQPLRRDELAYQRQMEVQSAQSVTTRTFGGQLTSSDAFAARPPAAAAQPSTVSAPRPANPPTEAFPSLASLSISNGATAAASRPVREAELTPQERARRMRHTAVTERASNLLRNDQSKLAEFRTKASSFKNSEITAASLVDDFFNLFDTSSTELGKVIKELAEIFEVSDKKDALLKAWNDWKAINEDYPTLPDASGISAQSAQSALRTGGSRVLKLKSSTAQSSRSAVSRRAGWGTASSSSLFPALPPAASANRAGAGRVGPTPWASAPAARSSPAPARPAPSSGRGATSNNNEAFPALPTAPKPKSTVFSPGYAGAAVRREGSGSNTPMSAWSRPNGGSNGLGSSAPGVQNELDAVVQTGKKGKKQKKQVLAAWG